MPKKNIVKIVAPENPWAGENLWSCQEIHINGIRHFDYSRNKKTDKPHLRYTPTKDADGIVLADKYGARNLISLLRDVLKTDPRGRLLLIKQLTNDALGS